MTDTNYFANGNMPYIERAQLLEDIDLSSFVNPDKLNLNYFDPEYISNPTCDHGTNSYWKYNNNKEYKLIYNNLPKFIEAPFFIPILAALYKGGSPNKTKTSSPSKRGFKGDSLTTSSLENSNYIKLKIPRYMILQFIDKDEKPYKIKKGTEFLIASVGGQLLAENIRIIGLWTL